MTDIISESEKSCQGAVGRFSGLTGNKIISSAILCGSWACPYCRKRKISQLRARVKKGHISIDHVSKYGLKFCTLTFGGNEKRALYILPGGQFDLTAMYEDMAEAFHKLVRALKKKYGHFHYLRVSEPHKDGVPHLHILFIGNNIVKKSFYDSISKLWRDTYDLGFIQLARVRWNDSQHAINYLLKYLTKDPKKPGHKKRIFTASRAALEPVTKRTWEMTQLILGHVDDSGRVLAEVIPEPIFGDLIELENCRGSGKSLIPRDAYILMRMEAHLKTLGERITKNESND